MSVVLATCYYHINPGVLHHNASLLLTVQISGNYNNIAFDKDMTKTFFYYPEISTFLVT